MKTSWNMTSKECKLDNAILKLQSAIDDNQISKNELCQWWNTKGINEISKQTKEFLKLIKQGE